MSSPDKLKLSDSSLTNSVASSVGGQLNSSGGDLHHNTSVMKGVDIEAIDDDIIRECDEEESGSSAISLDSKMEREMEAKKTI